MEIYTSQGCRLLKKIQNMLQQFYSYFKEITGTESNRFKSKSLDFTSSSKYERRSMVVKPVINQRIGEELLRNYHNT